MNIWEKTLAVAAIAISTAFAQEPKISADVESALEKAQEAVSKIDAVELSAQLAKTGATLKSLNIDVPSVDFVALKEQLAFLQATPSAARQTRVRVAGGDGGYESGTRLLDEHRYDEAIQRFDQVIAAKSDRSDGALYWKAYALNRVGRRDEALGAISALRRDYPSSHWLNDAQALEVEVKQKAGQPVSPADETNDDIKLMAINSLMNADPDRAIPLLENLLKSNAGPRVKDRAMFVLTQNRSARAQQVLANYAKGAGNPDLQLRSIRYIGMSGTPEAQQQLVGLYSATNDAAVKREIIRSLMVSNARDAIFNLAKSEKDATLREEAIRQLGAMRAIDQLSQLYASETAPEIRIRIVRSLMAAGASDKLLEIAKTEKDPQVRGEAIRNFAFSHNTSAENLVSIYTSDSDVRARKEIINALHGRGDAKALIDIARKETDPTMKKYIVERLSTMRNKEATDYMMELLK
jgi:tetratricopeptide (TPR) repeat protein